MMPWIRSRSSSAASMRNVSASVSACSVHRPHGVKAMVPSVSDHSAAT